MSAFILDKAEIDSIVHLLTSNDRGAYGKLVLSNMQHESPYLHEPCTNEEKTELGRLLWRLNLAGVAKRYPDDKSGERPGPNDFEDHHVEEYVFQFPRNSNLYTAIESIDTLLYQCEPGGFMSDRHRAQCHLIEWAQGRCAVDLLRARAENETHGTPIQ